MPLNRDQIKGTLILNDAPDNLTWGKPLDFIKKLITLVSVELPFQKNLDFVVTGSQVPGPDDKARLWVGEQKNGTFSGFFKFIKGQWRRIFNYRIDQVIWFVGDSRQIPGGFELIDGTVAGIPVAVQNFIVSKYMINTSITSPVVYQYFACRYTGVFEDQ